MWKSIPLILALIIPAFSETTDEVLKDAYSVLRIDEEKLPDSILLASFGLDIPKFHQAPEIEKEEPFKWKETLMAGTTLLTWISMGINEGQKWKQEGIGNIDFMWKDDYHMYRGVHNAGLLTTPLIALSMDRNKSSIKWIAGSNLIGWGLYEMALNYAENGSVVSEKPTFKVLGLHTSRPNALACFGLSVLGTIGLQYTF